MMLTNMSVKHKRYDITNLELIIENGGIWFLKKLLTGPYDDDFSIIQKR